MLTLESSIIADVQILVFKGWFPLSRNFSVRTHLKFTRVNEIEAMYERPRVNEELSDVQLLPLRVTFHTLPLFYLRASGHPPWDKWIITAKQRRQINSMKSIRIGEVWNGTNSLFNRRFGFVVIGNFATMATWHDDFSSLLACGTLGVVLFRFS